MQQQLFDFVPGATRKPLVRLGPEIADEITQLMATAILAVGRQTTEFTDEDHAQERQADG